jgi:glucans biosynthesis protein
VNNRPFVRALLGVFSFRVRPGWRALCLLALSGGAGVAFAAIEKLEVTYDYVSQRAAERAAAPYKEPDRELPKRLAELNYDDNREIRFRPEQALWRNESLPYHLHLFRLR